MKNLEKSQNINKSLKIIQNKLFHKIEFELIKIIRKIEFQKLNLYLSYKVQLIILRNKNLFLIN